MSKSKKQGPTIIVPPSEPVDPGPPAELAIAVIAAVIFAAGWGGKCLYDYRQEVNRGARIEDRSKCYRKLAEVMQIPNVFIDNLTPEHQAQSYSVSRFCEYLTERE